MAARSGMGHVTLACDGYPRLVPSDLAVLNNHLACIQLINAAFTPTVTPAPAPWPALAAKLFGPRFALRAAAEIMKATKIQLSSSSKPLARLHLFDGCRTSIGPVTFTLPATGTSWIQLYQATDLGLSFHSAP
jgi:hypothetical protein